MIKQRIHAAFAAALLIACFIFQTGCVDGSEIKEIGLLAETTERKVVLRWDSVDGANRYRLFRKSSDDSDFRFIDDVLEKNTYIDEYVEQDKTYSYKIKVYSGAREIASGICDPLGLQVPPSIVSIHQIEGKTFDVDWDIIGKECVIYGKTSSEWIEIGRGNEGRLIFENTENCTALSVATVGDDAIRSVEVPFAGVGQVISVTPLDTYTNVIEFDADIGQWKYEIARSDMMNGEYIIVGSTEDNKYYDISDAENTSPCWYRFRCIGDRSESTWSEAVQLGINARDVFYVPVILYHDFIPANEIDENIEFLEDVITPEEFENDLIWLKDHGYSTITTGALSEYLEGGTVLPDKPIILAIDDGKYGVYKWAWPILMKYGMSGTLAVIGSIIDEATMMPEQRKTEKEPYCTWDEIKEMYDSGSMEIISHTQNMHEFHHDGRQGANCAQDETAEQFLPFAKSDARAILDKIEQITGSEISSLAYPYSIRSNESDKAWRAVGYKFLLCGNNDDVHKSKWNPMIHEYGLNPYSSLIRRISRISGTSIGYYLRNYESLLAQKGRISGKEGGGS